jgi:hypothetical protein
VGERRLGAVRVTEVSEQQPELYAAVGEARQSFASIACS